MIHKKNGVTKLQVVDFTTFTTDTGSHLKIKLVLLVYVFNNYNLDTTKNQLLPHICLRGRFGSVGFTRRVYLGETVAI